jgi:hypothetical protein
LLASHDWLYHDHKPPLPPLPPYHLTTLLPTLSTPSPREPEAVATTVKSGRDSPISLLDLSSYQSRVNQNKVTSPADLQHAGPDAPSVIVRGSTAAPGTGKVIKASHLLASRKLYFFILFLLVSQNACFLIFNYFRPFPELPSFSLAFNRFCGLAWTPLHWGSPHLLFAAALAFCLLIRRLTD